MASSGAAQSGGYGSIEHNGAMSAVARASPDGSHRHGETRPDKRGLPFSGSGNIEEEGSDVQPLIPGNGQLRKGRSCSRTNAYIYISHFLSAWGDNMWTFAVGVFLVEIDGESLQLTASFGLTMGVATLLLGPVIGDWVDTMPRLRAAQEALVLQNVMIALCAGFIFNMLEYESEIEAWGDWAVPLHFALIILLGTGAFLAHIANIIAIERDWVVEICEQDEDKLATMSAAMRAIDLLAMIVAPMATGQVMTAFSSTVGALVIAGWNVASFFVEYFLLWLVYTSVPALQKEKSRPAATKSDITPASQDKSNLRLVLPGPNGGQLGLPGLDKSDQETNVDDRSENSNGQLTGPVGKREKRNVCTRGLQRIVSEVKVIVIGWRTFIRYEVALSGISLALLYMTVLGFDNITIGYAKMQCLTEFEVGLMMGGAGLIGALGTVTYPSMRRCLGLPWTGMLALALQSATLSMCVVSVWLPGSPFDMDHPDGDGVVCEANTTRTQANTTELTDLMAREIASKDGPTYTSIAVLMAGIIGARFGLWIADLAIAQMFMEVVAESERGVVNGVQQSLNQLMDVVKNVLVIILPKATQFGLLVLLSFAFVLSGLIMYIVFLVKVPRQLFQVKSSLGV